MNAGEAASRSIHGAALLFDRANVSGKEEAVEIATACIVSATVFLEEAIGTERTIAALNATIAALHKRPRAN
jgi:hypothetical protein